MNARAQNAVHVDESADLALLDSVAAEATSEIPPPPPDPNAPPPPNPEAWLADARNVAEIGSEMLCPSWQLTETDRERIARPLAALLDRWLPGGSMGVDNWHPLWQLAAACAVVTCTRGVDWSKKKLKPTHPRSERDDEKDPPREHHQETPGRDAPVSSGEEPRREDGRGFTIGGG
jgi:hypothetical protein